MMKLLTSGMAGEPLPYLLRTDPMITCLMFLCMFLLSFVFARGKKHLLQGVKNFRQNRERSSMFDEVTASDARHTSFLILHTCIVLGLCVYHYLAQTSPLLFDHTPHALLLAGLVLSFMALLFLKWSIYQGINWIFFPKVRNTLWNKAFVYLVIWFGILLLPLLMSIVYFDIPVKISIFLIASLLIFAKIALFWKCFSNFFEKIHGTFHLILYFCALEILPDLLFWKGMEIISNNLTLNL